MRAGRTGTPGRLSGQWPTPAGRPKVLSSDDALSALDAIAALELELIGGEDRWFRSLRAALDWQLTTYDALYVLLALDLDAELVTADIGLTDAALKRSLPVRPLIA